MGIHGRGLKQIKPTEKIGGGWRESPAAIFYNRSHALNLFVNFIFQLPRRA